MHSEPHGHTHRLWWASFCSCASPDTMCMSCIAYWCTPACHMFAGPPLSSLHGITWTAEWWQDHHSAVIHSYEGRLSHRAQEPFICQLGAHGYQQPAMLPVPDLSPVASTAHDHVCRLPAACRASCSWSRSLLRPLTTCHPASRPTTTSSTASSRCTMCSLLRYAGL